MKNLYVNFSFLKQNIILLLHNKYISSLVFLAFLTFSAYANTEKENGQDQQDNVSQQESNNNSGFLPSYEGENKNGSSEAKPQEEKQEIKADTTYNSFSKFNYIFYFIYKYKYENRSVGLDNLKDFTLMD